MIWGYALPWYGPFLTEDEDPLLARLKFLVRHDLKVTGVGLREIVEMAEDRRQRAAEFVNDHDLQLTPHVGFHYLEAGPDEAKKQADEIAGGLRRFSPVLRNAIVHTGASAGHRFDRTMPIEEKLERLSRALAPLAAACHEMGTPLCIENHGDYYCSDLVALCQRTPHLSIFLDTGNTYLIGERPMPAFIEAAPYTIGTHFKDHRVRPRPEARPLHFEVAGSPLGEGDVPLREAYQLLRERAPSPDRLVMEIEMICPDDMQPEECLQRSLEFVRGLDTSAS